MHEIHCIVTSYCIQEQQKDIEDMRSVIDGACVIVSYLI